MSPIIEIRRREPCGLCGRYSDKHVNLKFLEDWLKEELDSGDSIDLQVRIEWKIEQLRGD